MVQLHVPDQMKDRATHKEDVSASVKQLDIKGTVVVDVLVGTSGEVICVGSLVGHPLIATAVQRALRKSSLRDGNPRFCHSFLDEFATIEAFE
jgi:hypothetical protein